MRPHTVSSQRGMFKLNNTDLIYRFEHHSFNDNTFLTSSTLFTWRICSLSMMLTPDGHQPLMVKRVLLLCSVSDISYLYIFIFYLFGWSKVIKEFLKKYKNDFPKLHWFMFLAAEWDTFQLFQKILEVSQGLWIFSTAHWLTTLYKVPHVFQQQLSHEKTPTLCVAIPSFEAMMSTWV